MTTKHHRRFITYDAASPFPRGPSPYYIPLGSHTGVPPEQGRLVRTQCWPTLSVHVGPPGPDTPPEDWWGHDEIYFFAHFAATGGSTDAGDIISGNTVLRATLTPQIVPSISTLNAYTAIFSGQPDGIVSKSSRKGSETGVFPLVAFGFSINSAFLNTFVYTDCQISCASLSETVWEVNTPG